MLIRSLRLDGFLTFAPGSKPFELRSLNVLIGANGSGKSNLIEALRLLAAASQNLRQAVEGRGEWDEWLWKGHPSTDAARIEAELEGGDGPLHGQQVCRLTVGCGHARLELVGKNAQRRREASWAGEALSSIRILDGSGLAEQTSRRGAPHESPNEQPVRIGGREAKEALIQMVRSGDSRINDLLRDVHPGFERFSVQEADGACVLRMHEAGFGIPTPVARMSGGTLRFAALVSVLLSPSPPRLLCIDGPERGLHPDAASFLAKVLIEASSRMQLIVNTHSESLLSALSSQPDAVVVCERPGYATELFRLDPDRLENWREEYTLGDLWAMGVLGANP